MKNFKIKDKQFAIALILILLFAVFAIIKLFKAVPSDPDTIGITETIKAIALLVAGYYFGSSKSSQAKDEVIASQLSGSAPAPASAPDKPVINQVGFIQPKLPEEEQNNG